jgi:UDP-glucose 4-epimerase
VTAFETVWGKPIHTVEAPPRPGDIAGSYASAGRALELLGWKAERSTEEGIRDALKWGELRTKILKY